MTATLHERPRNMEWRDHAIDAYCASHAIRNIQFGAGGNVLPGWLNTDVAPASADVVYLDILDPLPFADGTIDRIFSEHLIEHITHTDASRHLAECRRVLKPGGILRVATPNLGFLIELYEHRVNNTDVERRYIERTVHEAFPATGFPHAGFAINNFFHEFGHQFIYDTALLSGALSRAGFTNITRHPRGASGDPQLRDLERHGDAVSEDLQRLQTMVFEATRPGLAAVA